MITLVPYRSDLAPDLLTVWHAAFGERYPIMPTLWEAITTGDPSFREGDVIVAMRGDRAVGFVLAKRFRETFAGCERFAPIGYVTLLAVHPEFQRKGTGARLLAAAEAQFYSDGVKKIVLGGSFHHVFPGIPADATPAKAFFTAHGYTLGKDVWDVRRNLNEPPDLPELPALPPEISLRPTRPGEEAAIQAFLHREFAGRWARDVSHHLAHGGPVEHVFGIFVDGTPQGFALLHPPATPGALRWAGFTPHVSALGPIGIGTSLRGKGLGLALLVRALEQLREWGATDTVIDWTDLLDFYARCGFRPWLRYHLAQKEV